MIVLCILLVLACWCDYKERKIPNLLLGVMFVSGWVYGVLLDGLWEVIRFPIESIVVILLLYPLFKIGAFGAGDVKIYSICAGYLPYDKFLFFFFLSLLIAAMISLIKMIKECNAIERISYFCEYILSVVQNGRFHLYFENEREQKAAGVCLAGPILGSILLYIGGIY